MEQIKLENKVCEITNRADEITINQMVKCDSIINDKSKPELDRYVEVVQTLTNLSIDDIEELPIDTLKDVIRVIGEEDFSLEGLPFKNEVVIGGVTYIKKFSQLKIM